MTSHAPSWASASAGLFCGLLLGALAPSQAATLTVPGQYASVQAAIDAALDGDVVLIDPGTYVENLVIAGKAITLASQFLVNGDKSFIQQTILDGDGGASVLEIAATAGPATRIVGLTLQNAEDGIAPYAKFTIEDSRITQTSDGIDYEDGSGGLVQRSTFEDNSDDGIDLDFAVEVTIETSIIRDNGNDGIEMRLQAYTGPTLSVVIRDNLIANNGWKTATPNGDGIQLIEYTPGSSREFTIERNLIIGNAQAGIGMMCCAQTAEDLEGASLLENIFVFNNTFAGNDHGITGGDNTVVVNNIFIDSPGIALKRVDGNSRAAYNLFHGNGTNVFESNVLSPTMVFADPKLDENYRPHSTSPAIDRGTATFTWNFQPVLDLPPEAYFGDGPDIGAVEFVSLPTMGPAGSVLVVVSMALAAGAALRGRPLG